MDGQIVIDTLINLSGINQGANQLQTAMSRIGSSVTNVGKVMTAAVTLPLAGIAIASVKTAMDFDAQMSRVGAIAGATGKEFDAMREKALELGASTSKSASEVAIGMENMAAMGFTANEVMAAMPGVIAAAEASGADMALTADVVASSLNIFGLEAAEATRVADILAMTANVSAADISTMQYALKYAGPSAAALGVSMEELSASIAIMSDSGMEGSQIGTTLRAAMTRLSAPTKKAQNTLDDLGITITDQNGKFVGLESIVGQFSVAMKDMTGTQKLAALSAVFGAEAATGMLSVIEAGPEKLAALTTELENSAGASAETAAQMKDNLAGALEEMGGAFETAAIAIGTALTPLLRKLAEIIQNLVQKFIELDPKVLNIVLVLAALAASIGPILIAVGLLITTIGVLMGLAALLGVSFMGLIGIFAAVAAGVAILIAAGIAIYLNWETVKNKTIEIWNAIIAFLQPAIDRIVSTIKERMTVVKEWWAELNGDLMEAFANIWNAITTIAETSMAALQAIFGWALPWLQLIFTTVWDAILGVIDGAISVIMGLIGMFAALFTGNWSMLWENTKTVLSGAWEIIISILQGAWDTAVLVVAMAMGAILEVVTLFLLSIWERIKAEFEIIKAFFSEVWTGIKEIFNEALEWIKALFATWGAAIMEVLNPIITYWSELFTTVWESIKGVFTAAMDWIKNLIAVVMGSEIMTEMKITFEVWKAAFSAAWEMIKATFDKYLNIILLAVTSWLDMQKEKITTSLEVIKAVFSLIWNNIKDVAIAVFNAIKEAVTKFVDDKKAKIEAVMNVIKGIFGDAWQWIKDKVAGLLGGITKDTSSKMDEQKTKVTSVLDTIKDYFSKVWENIKTLVGAAMDGIKAAVSIGMDAIKTIFSSIWEVIKGVFVAALMLLRGDTEGAMNRIKETIRNVMSNIKDFISTTWNTIKSTFSNILSAIVSTVGAKFVEMVSKVRAKMSEVKQAISDKWNEIKSYLSSIDLSQMGRDIIQGLINGVKSMAGNLLESAKGVVKGAIDGAKSLLGIASPSKVFTTIGNQVGEGFVNGIDAKRKEVKKSSEGMAKVSIPDMSKQIKEHSNMIKAHHSNIATINNNAAKAAAKINKNNTSARRKVFMQADEAILSDTKSYISDKNALNEISLKDEIKIWEKSVKSFRYNSDQKKLAQQELNKAKKALNQEVLNMEVAFIEEKKRLGGINLVQEVQMLEKLASKHKAASEERKSIELQKQEVLKKINDEMLAVNEDYAKRMQDINTTLKNDIAKVNEDLVKDSQATKDKLIQDEQRLTDAYNKAYESRIDAIVGFSGLFDSFTVKTEATGQQLIDNLQSQVDGLIEWRIVLDSLWGKIDNQALMEQIEAMGPDALGELRALNSMSAEQLTKYSELFDLKFTQAREQAYGELEGMRTDTKTQIEGLRKAATDELAKLNIDAAAKIKELRNIADKELTQLQKEWAIDIKKVTTITNDELKNLNQVGANAIRGLMNGMASMEGELKNKAKLIADSIKKTIEGALDIRSPSKVLEEIGQFVGKGLEIGIDYSTSGVRRSASDLALAAIPNLEGMANRQVMKAAPSISPLLRSNQPVREVSNVTKIIETPINFYGTIREEADVTKISQELYTLQKQASRRF